MGAQWAAQWKVTSFTTDKTYTVSVAKTGRWACDCPAHKFARNPKPMCKHILHIRKVEEVPIIGGVPVQVMANNQRARYLDKKTVLPVAKVVAQTGQMLVIQTRREICLEED